eukprot:6930511-Pyramimonas_sp.AAC.1
MVLRALHPPAHPTPPPVVNLVLAEDIESVITIVHEGRAPALRHLHRTRRISSDWITETCQQERSQFTYVGTKEQ